MSERIHSRGSCWHCGDRFVAIVHIPDPPKGFDDKVCHPHHFARMRASSDARHELEQMLCRHQSECRGAPTSTAGGW